MDNSIEMKKEYLAERLRTVYVPYYVNWFEKLPINTNMIYIVVGLMPCFVLIFLSKIVNTPLTFTTIWIFLNISTTIIAAHTLLGNAYNKTINSLNETIKILNNEKQISKFEDYIILMFKSKYQMITCILFTLICMTMLVLMDISMQFPFKIYLYIVCIFTFFSAGPGVWLAITSAYFISQMKKIGELKLNTVYPSKTLGLTKMSKLLTTFSISFSVEALLFFCIFFFAPWNNMEMHEFFTIIIVMPVILFMLFFFIYPQIGIKNIIVDYKENVLMDIENKIRDIYAGNIQNVGELELMSKYSELYKEISSSSNYAIDLNILIKFATSIIFPLLFILKQN